MVKFYGTSYVKDHVMQRFEHFHFMPFRVKTSDESTLKSGHSERPDIHRPVGRTVPEATKAVGSAVTADGAQGETAILSSFFTSIQQSGTWQRRMMRSRVYNKMPHSAKDLTTD